MLKRWNIMDSHCVILPHDFCYGLCSDASWASVYSHECTALNNHESCACMLEIIHNVRIHIQCHVKQCHRYTLLEGKVTHVLYWMHWYAPCATCIIVKRSVFSKGGYIAAIVICSLIGIGTVAVFVYCCCCKKSKSNAGKVHRKRRFYESLFIHALNLTHACTPCKIRIHWLILKHTG